MLKATDATAQAVVKSGLFHRVYLPEGKPKGLAVLIHGRAGNAEVIWVFSKVFASLGFAVVSPQALVSDPLGGFSWWLVDRDEKEVSDSPTVTKIEDLEPGVLSLENFIDILPEFYPVELDNIFCVGFSQGGAIAASLSLKYPSLFKGVALLSSFVPSVLFDEEKTFVKQKVLYGEVGLADYFIFHGTNDEIVKFENAQNSKMNLESIGANVSFESDAVAHKVSSSGIKALSAWVKDKV